VIPKLPASVLAALLMVAAGQRPTHSKTETPMAPLMMIPKLLLGAASVLAALLMVGCGPEADALGTALRRRPSLRRRTS
jgi:hypothetical protein